MSYSFTARGATKEDVLKHVTEQFDQIIVAQPKHAADREQAYNAAEWFLSIMPEAADQDYSLSLNGSLGWNDDGTITGAAVGVSVRLVPKEA